MKGDKGEFGQNEFKNSLCSLKKQVTELNMPLSVVTTNYIGKEICRLQDENAEKAKSCHIIHQCAYFAHKGFLDCHQLLTELCDKMAYIPVELVWQLHTARVADVVHYLHMLSNYPVKQQWLEDKLLEATLVKNDSTRHVTDMLGSLLMHSFVEDLWKVSPNYVNQSQNVAYQTVDRFFQKHLKIVLEPGYEYTECPNVYKMLRDSNTVTHDVLHRFYKLQLNSLLVMSPHVEDTYAITEQSNWMLNTISNAWIEIFSELIICFSAQDIVALIRHILKEMKVSWKMMLGFISVTATVYQESGPYFEKMISELINEAFHSLNVEHLRACFLVVRQITQEECNSNFPTYSTWFLNMFGSAGKSVANTTKKLAFFIQFLTDLVPFESAKYLTAHVLQPPYTGRKSRDKCRDYISLARTRLFDLTETLHEGQQASDAILYRIPESEKRKVEAEVKNALESYATSGIVPAFVMEMSVFSAVYFKGSFLRELLTPRTLPAIPDVKMKFIAHLLKIGKISPLLYTQYVNTCNCEKEISGLSKDDAPGPKTVFENILRDLENYSEFLERNLDDILVAIGKLPSAIHDVFGNDGSEPVSIIKIDIRNVVPLESSAKIVICLLNTFCKMVAPSRGLSDFILQPKWATKFVSAIGNCPCIHHGLYTWLMHAIIVTNMQNLQPYHVQGLGAFMLYMSDAKELKFPTVELVSTNATFGNQIKGFADMIWELLPIHRKENMIASFRLIVSYLSHKLFNWSSYNFESSLNLPSPLSKKFQLLSMRFLHVKSCKFCDASRVTDNLLNAVSVLSNSSVIKKCCKDSLLTFDEWAEYESNVEADFDYLKESCRNNYRVQLIETYPWPMHGNSYRGNKSCDMLTIISVGKLGVRK